MKRYGGEALIQSRWIWYCKNSCCISHFRLRDSLGGEIPSLDEELLKLRTSLSVLEESLDEQESSMEEFESKKREDEIVWKLSEVKAEVENMKSTLIYCQKALQEHLPCAGNTSGRFST